MLRINPSTEILDTPLVNIFLGTGDKFSFGDGRLISVEVTLAEGEAASNCSFTIYDPEHTYTDKFFAAIESQNGLTPVQRSESNNSSQPTGNSVYTGNLRGQLPENVRNFLGNNPALLNRVNQALEFYLNAGFTRQGSAAIVGNLIQESSLRPGAVATDQGVNNPSEGLLQFTAERRRGLPRTFEGQLAFVIRDMNTDYGGRGLQAKLSNPSIPLSQLQNPIFNWVRYGHVGRRWEFANSLLTYLNSQSQTPSQSPLASPTAAQQNSSGLSIQTAPIRPVEANTGAQITIELGGNGRAIARYSFLHTSLAFDLFAPDTLTFGGTAASFVMTRMLQNTVYTNLTFKQIAERICQKYGMRLVMEDDGVTLSRYEQTNLTDYAAILEIARRKGYRVYTEGNRLIIRRRFTNWQGFTIEYGDKLGTRFTVKHQASSTSQGGARSSNPGETSSTGQRRAVIDMGSGRFEQVLPEQLVTTASNPTQGSTGSNLQPLAPLEETPEGESDTASLQSDAVAQGNEGRYKQFVAELEMPTSFAVLSLTPDDPVRTKNISQSLDRFWVVDTITHKLDQSGYNSSLTLYSPGTARQGSEGSEDGSEGSENGSEGEVPPLNPNGFIVPVRGVVTSPFRPPHRPRHFGIDYGAAKGTPVWASADGVVINTVSNCVIGDQLCGGGFGNRVYIQHANGIVTRYAHLTDVRVTLGDQVKQGQVIGTVGNTGASRGFHLHVEFLVNGRHVNPANYLR